jgi:Lectin C-type domain/FG-GAP-like repeat/RTX calcium-binding nonapeptide repeat (4 copies)
MNTQLAIDLLVTNRNNLTTTLAALGLLSNGETITSLKQKVEQIIKISFEEQQKLSSKFAILDEKVQQTHEKLELAVSHNTTEGERLLNLKKEQGELQIAIKTLEDKKEILADNGNGKKAAIQKEIETIKENIAKNDAKIKQIDQQMTDGVNLVARYDSLLTQATTAQNNANYHNQYVQYWGIVGHEKKRTRWGKVKHEAVYGWITNQEQVNLRDQYQNQANQLRAEANSIQGQVNDFNKNKSILQETKESKTVELWLYYHEWDAKNNLLSFVGTQSDNELELINLQLGQGKEDLQQLQITEIPHQEKVVKGTNQRVTQVQSELEQLSTAKGLAQQDLDDFVKDHQELLTTDISLGSLKDAIAKVQGAIASLQGDLAKPNQSVDVIDGLNQSIGIERGKLEKLKQQYQLLALEELGVNQERLESFSGQLASEVSVNGGVKINTIDGYVVLVSQLVQQLTGLGDIWVGNLKENHHFTVDVNNLLQNNLTAFEDLTNYIGDNLADPYGDYLLNKVQLHEAIALQDTQVKYRDALAKAVDDLGENIALQKKSVQQSDELSGKLEHIRDLIKYEKGYATLKTIQDKISRGNQVLAFDYNGDGKEDLFLYRPGRGAASVARSNGDGTFTTVYDVVDDGSVGLNGIGSFDLLSSADQVLAFDYNRDGKEDLFLYRPGRGAASVARSNGDGTFTTVYDVVDDGSVGLNGIGGFDLLSSADQVLAFDYNGDGKEDLFLYRPGRGAASVARSNGDGTFTTVYDVIDNGSAGLNGIGGFDLLSSADQVLAFDYNGDGKEDLFLYRPGRGAASVARSNGDGTFTTVYDVIDNGSAGLNGIAGYDFLSTNDRALAFDYNGDGYQDLVLYRIGQAGIWIARSNGDGSFTSVNVSSDVSSFINAELAAKVGSLEGETAIEIEKNVFSPITSIIDKSGNALRPLLIDKLDDEVEIKVSDLPNQIELTNDEQEQWIETNLQKYIEQKQTNVLSTVQVSINDVNNKIYGLDTFKQAQLAYRGIFTLADGGWTDQNIFPRHLADVNGDGNADIVGFAHQGVYVALAKGDGTFGEAKLAYRGIFTVTDGGWTSQDKYPRYLADINGDGNADIVGFAHYGVEVALAKGDGTFGEARLATKDSFTVGNGGWISQDKYPRHLADINGDGKGDIVGFGQDAVYTQLSNGDGTFASIKIATNEFSVTGGGWISQDKYPRHLADINGDGNADIVGFAHQGIYVALAKGDGTFGNAQLGYRGIFTVADGGWTSQDTYPRYLADVNGDKKADILGFAHQGVYIALANGNGTFGEAQLAYRGIFTLGDGGWTNQNIYPRHLADINGDGNADIVGFAHQGVHIALNDVAKKQQEDLENLKKFNEDKTISDLQKLRLETAYLTLQAEKDPDKLQKYLQDYNSLTGIIKYNSQNGHYYSLTKSTTWTEAQAEARRLGGNLITINNADEQQWILNTFGTTGNYWIGLKKNLSNGAWEWTNGEAINYLNWSPSEPNNGGGIENYGMIIGDQDANYAQGKWNDYTNSSILRSQSIQGIIEIDPNKADWKKLAKYNSQTGNYYVLSKITSWTEAQAEAQRLGGNLITINNADEQQWILNTFGTTGNYWIGLKKNLSNGAWEWTNGEAVNYLNWSPSEPNNGGGIENYGMIIGDQDANYAQGKWNDWTNSSILRGQGLRGIIEINLRTQYYPDLNQADTLYKLQTQIDKEIGESEKQIETLKNSITQKQAESNATLTQAEWYEAQAKIHWDLSHKNGPTWVEWRIEKSRTRWGRVKHNLIAVTHVDHHWIIWNTYTQQAAALKQHSAKLLQGIATDTANQNTANEILKQWQAANAVADETALTQAQLTTLLNQLEADRQLNADKKQQIADWEKLLPTLQSQLDQAIKDAETAKNTVTQEWTEYQTSQQDYQNALGEVLTRRAQLQTQGQILLQEINAVNQWVTQQNTLLADEISQVETLITQLTSQRDAIPTTLPNNQTLTLKALLDQSIQLLTQKQTVLTSQQSTFIQKQTLLETQKKVIQTQYQLLDAYLDSPDNDTSNLENLLTDTRATLAEVQKLAEQAEASSNALTALMDDVQTSLLLQNDKYLSAIKDKQQTLQDLLKAAELKENDTLKATQKQLELNNLETQLIPILQKAKDAGSQEAAKLLEIASYNNFAAVAELYYRDYKDLASDKGGGCAGGIARPEDFQLANYYYGEMLKYRQLKTEAEAQVAQFTQIRTLAASQITAIQQQQTLAAEELAQLNKSIGNSQEQIEAKQEELAIAQFRIDALAQIRNWTEQTITQLLSVETLNLAQAQLEQEIAKNRQYLIDDAVKATLDKQRLELERNRQIVVVKLEQLNQINTEQALQTAINNLRSDLGVNPLEDIIQQAEYKGQLAGILADLDALNQQQPNLPESLKTLLTATTQDIHSALQGQEAKTIQENLLNTATALIEQSNTLNAEVTKLDQEEQQYIGLLKQSETDIQGATKALYDEIQKSQVLDKEKELINAQNLEILYRIGYAQGAVDLSSELAKESQQILSQIIEGRIAERKVRKKAFVNELLGTAILAISAITAVMTAGVALASSALIGSTTILGVSTAAITGVANTLTAISASLSATQSFYNGDIEGAIFHAGRAVLGFSGLSGKSQQIVSGLYSSYKASDSGEGLTAFLTFMGTTLPLVSEYGYLAQASLSIHNGIQLAEEDNWLAATSSFLSAAYTLGKNLSKTFPETFGNNPGEKPLFSDELLDIISQVKLGVNIASGIKTVIDNDSLEGWLIGIQDIASGLTDYANEHPSPKPPETPVDPGEPLDVEDATKKLHQDFEKLKEDANGDKATTDVLSEMEAQMIAFIKQNPEKFKQADFEAFRTQILNNPKVNIEQILASRKLNKIEDFYNEENDDLNTYFKERYPNYKELPGHIKTVAFMSFLTGIDPDAISDYLPGLGITGIKHFNWYSGSEKLLIGTAIHDVTDYLDDALKNKDVESWNKSVWGISNSTVSALKMFSGAVGKEVSDVVKETVQSALKPINYTTKLLDPLIIDLNNDGLQLISLENSSTRFDIDADGYTENTAWVSPEDGILTIDLNGDGTINNISEIFSEHYGDGTPNSGLNALSTLDSNQNGIISATDAQYNQILVWQDLNQDGISQANELKTLSQHGINSINLNGLPTQTIQDGNIIRTRSIFNRNDGTLGQIADVAFLVTETGFKVIQTPNGIQILAENDSATSLRIFSDSANHTLNLAEVKVQVAIGNAGQDTFYTTGSEGVFLSGDAGDDSLTGGIGNDWIIGDTGVDRLLGEAGNDILYIDAQDTLIDGGEGQDIAIVATSQGVTLDLGTSNLEMALGNDGHDTFTNSSAVSVVIDAGKGNDTVTGGTGADILTGGEGADTFRFPNPHHSPKANPDRLEDFQPGTDFLDIPFVYNLNELTLTRAAEQTTLTHKTLDFSLTLQGSLQLGNRDFILPYSAPSELMFTANITEDTLTLTNAWVKDLNGSDDLTRVDLWVLNPRGQWINVSDSTTFTPWTGGNEWGEFNYSLDLSNYEAGNYTIWGQATDKTGATSSPIAKTFTVLNSAPSELMFTPNIIGDTLTLTNAWVKDLNGSDDLTRVDLWIKPNQGNWIDVSDATTFTPWAGGEEWGSFDYSLSLGSYAPDSYTLWGQAWDRSGAVSNEVTRTFEMSASNPSVI